jgi:hypothetical protein
MTRFTATAWLEDQQTRCPACMPKSMVEISKNGCDGCGLLPAPRSLVTKLSKESEIEEAPTVTEAVAHGIDTLARAELEAKGVPATDANMAAARVELRKRFPNLAELERATRESLSKQRPTVGGSTFGERVTAAIDRRARAWHAEGLHFDKSLAELRRQIRKAQPPLVAMERSTETAEVAKGRIEKSGDRDLLDALRFVKDWG